VDAPLFQTGRAAALDGAVKMGGRHMERTASRRFGIHFLLVLILLWAVGIGSVGATSAPASALDYLERVDGKQGPYLPPSEIHPDFTLAFYVNARGSGPFAQRMWVLQRPEPGGDWELALWDEDYWKRKEASGEPPLYSWPVSTGKVWRGEKKPSGPTPLGVFAIDERPGRIQRGYHAPGMIHTMYIDYHYRSGRRSGVAFHGTSRRAYRKLGRIASHGCIRMTQENAVRLLDRLVGNDGLLEEELRWGEVPRFWSKERGGTRYGYRKDGRLIRVEEAAEFEEPKQEEEGGESRVLTKTGYRALAVIFKE